MILFAAVLFCVGAASAERILSVDMDIYKNDSVRLNYARLEEGNPTQYITPGDYELRLTGSSGEILSATAMKLSFLILSDPPTDIDPLPVSLRIKYDPRISRMSLLKSGDVVFSGDLVLCNGDGKCDPTSETYLSCPGDCPLGGFDGICIKDKDGVCDPDCMKGADPDCVKNGSSPMQWLYVPVLLALVLLLVFLFFKMKKKH